MRTIDVGVNGRSFRISVEAGKEDEVRAQVAKIDRYAKGLASQNAGIRDELLILLAAVQALYDEEARWKQPTEALRAAARAVAGATARIRELEESLLEGDDVV